MLRRFGISFLLALLCRAALAASPVGTWIDSEEGVTVTFRQDGSLAIETPSGLQEGSWSVDGGTLVMTLQPPGAETPVRLTCNFAVAGKDLHITPGDAKCGEIALKRAD